MQQFNVEPFRIHVSRIGAGYLAENEPLQITLGADTASEAAEKIRTVAADILASAQTPLPSTLLARIDEEHRVAFVMRPFAECFDLTAGAITAEQAQ
jgi:hypothetical protein